MDVLKSKRFWTAVAGVLFVVSSQVLNLPFTETQIAEVVGLLAAWIVGDSLRGAKP